MIHSYKTGGLVFASDLPLTSLPPATTPGERDVHILLQPLPAPADLQTVEKLERLGLHPGVATDRTGFCLDWHRHGRFRIEAGSRIYYNKAAGNSEAFEHFLVNEVMAGIFFQRGFFLLHGSAALLPDGTAAVFFGEPGAGKSTTLGFFVQHGCQVLTDEIVLVQFREGIPYVQPFIPVLRLWSSAAVRLGYGNHEAGRKYEIPVTPKEDAVPLKAAFSLRKGDHFAIRTELTHREHLDLFGNFPLPDALLTPAEQARRFQQSAELIRRCTVYQVSRTDQSFDEMDAWVGRFLS